MGDHPRIPTFVWPLLLLFSSFLFLFYFFFFFPARRRQGNRREGIFRLVKNEDKAVKHLIEFPLVFTPRCTLLVLTSTVNSDHTHHPHHRTTINCCLRRREELSSYYLVRSGWVCRLWSYPRVYVVRLRSFSSHLIQNPQRYCFVCPITLTYVTTAMNTSDPPQKATPPLSTPVSTEDAFTVPLIGNCQLNQVWSTEYSPHCEALKSALQAAWRCVEQDDRELVIFPCPTQDQRASIRKLALSERSSASNVMASGPRGFSGSTH